MNSYPSPGDALPRFYKFVREELKRLANRQASQAQKIAELEARVEALENP